MAWATDDLDALFDSDMPGYELATLTGGDVGGLFRAPFSNAFGLVPDAEPQFTCRTSSVSGVQVNDSVTINGTVYNVTSIEPDANGVTVLVLK